MTFIFSPPDGLRNKVTYPTTPANEDAARDQVQVGMDQLRDYINNTLEPTLTSTTNKVDTMPFNMARQALINGNFDIWQRGVSFTNPANGAYTADRYIINTANTGMPANATHSRVTLNAGELPGSFYAYRLTVDGAGTDIAGNNTILRHRIEYGTRYLCGTGKQVTVSFWARSSIAGKRLGVNLDQIYGIGGSPGTPENITGSTVTLTSTFTKYIFTFTTNTLTGKTFGTNNDDYLQLSLWYQWGSSFNSRLSSGTSETFGGSGTIDITQIQVCAGNIALPFQPRSFADELTLCQRYYEKSFPYSIAPSDTTGNIGAEYKQTTMTTNFQAYDTIRFMGEKRTTPTITLYNPGASSVDKIRNSTDSTNLTAAISNIASTSFQVYVNNVSTAAGKDLYFHFTADAEL